LPELPDVEVFKQYIDATSLHQKVKDVEIRSRQILEGTSAQKLKAELGGRAFESTQRHGKHLFVQLDDGHWLMLHFGMTGDLKYFKDMEKDTPHDRLLFSFSNGYHLAYDSQRKLGEVERIEDIEQFVEERELGPDALDPDLDFAAFKQALAGRRAMAKSALMNQQIIAGIGNVYSDEILFQAGVHPRTKTNQLDEETLAEIFNVMKRVLCTGKDYQTDPDQFPESYIIPHPHGDGKCPRCGGELKRVKVSGRSAYYCPNCQGEQR
jgi:formamidopyrimidine-DNA glycosylase